jgi:hypothetical protein
MSAEAKNDIDFAQVYNFIRTNDLIKLFELSGSCSDLNALWNTVFAMPEDQFQKRNSGRNSGTVLHWAIWHRHWGIVALALSTGASVKVKGTGDGWMNKRTPLAYAELLDKEAGHPYYAHKKCLEVAIEKSVFLAIQDVRDLTLLETSKWEEDLDDEKTLNRFQDAVEYHSITALKHAFEKFDVADVKKKLVHATQDRVSEGTLAHFAIYHQEWEVLKYLQEVGCIDLKVKGEGFGWMKDRAIEEYAEFLDGRTGHKYYEYKKMLQETLNPPSAPVAQGENDQSEDGKCVICIDQGAIYAVVPCGHLCVCESCKGNVINKCPVCRGNAQMVMKVYK